MAASSTETPISPVGTSKPELTISAPAVNDVPAELDSTPTSPEKVRRNSRPPALEDLSVEERERRAKLMSERKSDPAVLVDIPQTPGAEEFGKSSDAEAAVAQAAAASS